jgi:hypothetical protein
MTLAEQYSLVEEILLQSNDVLSSQQQGTLYVALLDYYIGEHNGVVLAEQITALGPEIIPSLVVKRSTALQCEDSFQSICYKSENERNNLLSSILRALRDGYRLYSEYPAELEGEAVDRLNVLKVFLYDYSIVKGAYPDTLQKLRAFVWESYGYSLSITNPWGKPMNYGVNGSSYSLSIGER